MPYGSRHHLWTLLRNTIVHGALRLSFPPAAAVEMVDNLHQAIADIYSRAARRKQSIT